MNKTEFSTYDIKEIFNNMWLSKRYDITEINEYQQTQKQVDVVDYIKLYTYEYKLDLKENSLFESDDYNFPNLDRWLESRGDTSRTYCLIEKTKINLTASSDLDMGSVNARATIICNQDKAEIIENHINIIRDELLGKALTYFNREQDNVTIYINIGDINYETEPFTSALGRTLILSIDFTISYINGADTYTDLGFKISLNASGEYKSVPFAKMTTNYVFTSKPNISQDKPNISATMITNLTRATTISFWANKYDKTLVAIDRAIRKQNANRYSATEPTTAFSGTSTGVGDVNIPIYIAERSYYYDNDGVLQEEWLVTKMVVSGYKVEVANSDFINVILSLNQYAKGW